MSKKNLNKISVLFYGIAIAFFCGYLITKGSGFMAAGGLCMIVGGITMIMAKKNK